MKKEKKNCKSDHSWRMIHRPPAVVRQLLLAVAVLPDLFRTLLLSVLYAVGFRCCLFFERTRPTAYCKHEAPLLHLPLYWCSSKLTIRRPKKQGSSPSPSRVATSSFPLRLVYIPVLLCFWQTLRGAPSRPYREVLPHPGYCPAVQHVKKLKHVRVWGGNKNRLGHRGNKTCFCFLRDVFHTLS